MDYEIGLQITIGTIVCLIGAILSFVSGAGAVLPKMGRKGLSTKIISLGMIILAILSSVTVSF